MLSKALRHQEMRGHNVQFVLALIQYHGPISRPHLAQLSGLTKASITRIVRVLSDNGLVEQAPTFAMDTGGRPAELIRMRPGKFFSVGVDLRIDRWAILVRDLSGQELARDRFLPEANAGAPAVLKGIAGVIKRLTANLPHELMGIGVAVGGTPRPDHRGLLRSHYLEWRNVDVQAILREELQSPDLQCFVHDVASCAAEANATILPNEDRSELLHLQCGIGLGAGEPSPLHVSIPDAFKTNYIGHLPFGAIEEPCQVCGWKGCVDSVLGFHALVKRTEQLGITVRETPDFIIEYCQELVARWEAGDKLAEEIIGDLALDLAKLIVLLIMSKEVSVITLGGWSSHLGDRFVTLVEDIVRSNRLSSHAKVEVSQSGDDASAIGAAMLGAMVGITARLVKNDPE